MFTDVVGVLWVGLERDLGRTEGAFLMISTLICQPEYGKRRTDDVESEDLDSVILFTGCCFLPSVELLTFPYKSARYLYWVYESTYKHILRTCCIS